MDIATIRHSDTNMDLYRYPVDYKTLEHGCRMIYAGGPHFFQARSHMSASYKALTRPKRLYEVHMSLLVSCHKGLYEVHMSLFIITYDPSPGSSVSSHVGGAQSRRDKFDSEPCVLGGRGYFVSIYIYIYMDSTGDRRAYPSKAYPDQEGLKSLPLLVPNSPD